MSFKKTLIAGLVTLFGSGVTHAAIVLGGVEVVSERGMPFQADVTLSADSRDELRGLMVGLATFDSLAGRKPKGWERPDNLSFSIKRKDDQYVLSIRSQEPVAAASEDVVLKIQTSGQVAVKKFRFIFNDDAPAMAEVSLQLKQATLMAESESAGHQAPAPESVAAKSNQQYQTITSGVLDQSSAPELQTSTGLSYMVTFKPGSVTLTPAAQQQITEIASASKETPRITLMGWAGRQADQGKRTDLAFNRAYNVRYAMAKAGVAQDRLKIIKPGIALDAMDQQNDKSPRVMVSLLSPNPFRLSEAAFDFSHMQLATARDDELDG